MSKNEFYRQALLTKKIDNSTIELVTWIPEKFCVIGKEVNVEIMPDVWDIRTVSTFSRKRIQSDKIHERERFWRQYRSRTDV